MTHYTVLVTLPGKLDRADLDTALTQALAPFDEALEIEKVDADDGHEYWRNPRAKWDWWAVGGRWSGRFHALPDAQPEDLIAVDYRGTFADQEPALEPGQVDGGRKRALQRVDIDSYAVLDTVLDGGWYAPGEMGWFGMSSETPDDKAQHQARLAGYVDRLDGEDWLVLVDCHI